MTKDCKECGGTFESKYKTQVFCHNDCNLKFHYKKRKKSDSKPDWRKQRYGISEEAYNVLVEVQQSKCKICGLHVSEIPKKVLYVDHCHKTKRVRGLLCNQCNIMLGMSKDNILVLESAIKYLKT